MPANSFRPVGLYLCISNTLPPTVSLLTERERDHLSEGDRIAANTDNPEFYTRQNRRGILRHDVTDYLIPAWSDPALAMVIDGYTGPFAEQVKGLAACLLTGTSYSLDRDSGDSSDGGVGARIEPVEPRLPPGGNKVQAGGSPDRSPLAKLAFG